jgi:cholera toxin transcriptional activator
LFSLIQIIYLSFYIVSLARLSILGGMLTLPENQAHIVLVLLITTAAVGIPTRLYLLAAVAFNYRGLNAKFQKLFPFLLILDELWALAPFLIVEQIGAGLALAATAALLYLPFSQRSLLLMGALRQVNQPGNQ